MSRSVSRSALEPSPSVIRPATSTTLTSPTCRVLNLTLTSALLNRLKKRYRRRLRWVQIFYHRNFHAGIQPAHAKLIHESADKKNTAAGTAHQILRRQRIRQFVGVESIPFIRNRNGETIRA